MTPERWEQIESIYHIAQQCDPGARETFLDQACGSDLELRLEISSLLAYDNELDHFLEAPPLNIILKSLAASGRASFPARTITQLGVYQIRSLLGRGGMGEVYLAHDARLGRNVAVKLLPAEFTSDEGLVRRFAQEARAVSALNHPNILTIHEIGEASQEDGGARFIVTEYVEGETLRQAMTRASQSSERNGIGASTAIDIALQIAAALTAAHQTGIVHRDIKPENVMLRRDGLVKVLDFGLAKLSERQRDGEMEGWRDREMERLTEGEREGERLSLLPSISPSLHLSIPPSLHPSAPPSITEAGFILGTPRYMSPEQAGGGRVDARTDIFSLGVVLYEMITGRPPFEGESPSKVIAAILCEDPPPITQHGLPTSPGLERILKKSLHKNREERYQTSEEMLGDLKRLKRRLELRDELNASDEAEAYEDGPGRSEIALEPPETAPLVEEDRLDRASENGRPRAFLAAMTALTIATFFFALTCALTIRYSSTEKFGYRTRLIAGQQTVRDVQAQGPAAGRLEAGDRILALNGDSHFFRVEPFVLLQTLPEQSVYTLRVQRMTNGLPLELEFTLPCTPYRSPDVMRGLMLWTNLARALACLAVAFLIIWLKPGETFPLLACVAFLTIGLVEMRVALNPIQEQLTGVPRILMLAFWAVTGGHLFIPFAYQTAYHFPPEALRKSSFWTALQWLLYAGLIVGASRGLISRLFGEVLQQIDLLYRHAALFAAIKSFADWYNLVGLAAISAVLIRNYRATKEPQQRSRIKWVIAGTLTAALALAVIEGARLALTAMGRDADAGSIQFKLLTWAANTLALVFPLSWAYAILNRRIYDVGFVIRRSMRYLLAKNALRLALALPLAALALSLYNNRGRTLTDFLFHNTIWFYASLLAVTAIELAYRYNLREWLDRRFFREAYQQEKVLLELTQEIRHLSSLSEMTRRVGQKVDAALHPERLYLFYREEGRRDLSLGFSSVETSRALHVPAEFELLRSLESRGGPQTVSLSTKIGLPPQEMEWLASLGADLVAPIRGTNNQLSGLIVLGPKKSESPYTNGDRQFLEMLADQIALVTENAQLKARVAHDRWLQRLKEYI
jgi:serine/threonine protein kinase